MSSAGWARLLQQNQLRIFWSVFAGASQPAAAASARPVPSTAPTGLPTRPLGTPSTDGCLVGAAKALWSPLSRMRTQVTASGACLLSPRGAWQEGAATICYHAGFRKVIWPLLLRAYIYTNTWRAPGIPRLEAAQPGGSSSDPDPAPRLRDGAQPSPVPDHRVQHPACPATCTRMAHTDFYYPLKCHKSPRTPCFTAALWRGACLGSGLGALPKAPGMSWSHLKGPHRQPHLPQGHSTRTPEQPGDKTTFREICLSNAGACRSTERAWGFPRVLQTNKRAREAELKGEQALPTLPERHRCVRAAEGLH